jgi:hypothetical protein
MTEKNPKSWTAYCFVCKTARKSGYCKGTHGKPRHAPEACPPCGNCHRRCNWLDETGCSRFVIKAKHKKTQGKEVTS